MPFNRPTLKELDERIRNDYASRIRVDNGTRSGSLLRRATVYVLARVQAGAIHLLYAFLDWLASQRFVHSMEDEFLAAEGLTYEVRQKGERQAEGKIIVFGKTGAIVPVLSLCQRADGVRFQVTGETPLVDGKAVLPVKAVLAGPGGNSEAGTKLTFIKSIPDIEATCVVAESGMYNGVDIEPADEYRERILDRKRQPPHGGAKHDYVAWAKEVPGVTRAWCLPLWMGEGTVGVMFARDHDRDAGGNYTIFPNEEQCHEVWAHIEGKRPVTATQIYVFSPIEHAVEVTVKIWPDNKTIRAAVEAEVKDFVTREGKSEDELEGRIYVSRLSEAISQAVGEHHHELILPINDVIVAENALPVVKRVVFVDHDGTERDRK
jgi:Uncharacterized homolog of phage Mu protein gp47